MKHRSSFNLFSAFLFTLVAVLMIPLLALAQANPTTIVPATQEWWQVLVSALINLFITFAIPIIVIVLYRISERYKIGIEQDQIDKIVTTAAGWAEEKASQALNKNGKKTPGAEKLDMAVTFALQLAKQFKLQEKATKGIDDLITAKLGQKKIEATKETKAVV